ncbi:MAG: tyrosine-type recombinase/integrase [Verrucomicrobia bacterium]|nr:tyrosine-type recombinase/integrase [Verrucomicrobiota bacterium]
MICFVFKPKRRVHGVLRVSKTYFGKLQMPWEHGGPSVIALDTTDKRVAVDALNQMVKERHQERLGQLAPRETREAAERPLNELLEAFLDDLKAKGRSENTLAKYRSNVGTLFAACGWTELRSVTARTFCQWRTASDLSPKSKNDTLANACGFFGWLQRQRMTLDNPLENVGRVDTRLVPRFRRALSEAEQARLLGGTGPKTGRAGGARDFRNVIYLLVLETGIRRNELQNMKVGDLNFDTPAPFIRIPAAIAKGRREAHLRLRPHVVEAVRSVLPPHALDCEWVFRSRVPRISTIKRDLGQAGIPFENEHGRMDLHGLRVTFCTNLLNAGVHPRVVQELMRHSDIKLTMKNYTDTSQLPLAAALDKLPKVPLRNDTHHDTHDDTQTLSAAVLVESGEVAPVQSRPHLQSG